MLKTYIVSKYARCWDKIVYYVGSSAKYNSGILEWVSDWNTDINKALCIDDFEKAKKIASMRDNGTVLEIDFVKK